MNSGSIYLKMLLYILRLNEVEDAVLVIVIARNKLVGFISYQNFIDRVHVEGNRYCNQLCSKTGY